MVVGITNNQAELFDLTMEKNTGFKEQAIKSSPRCFTDFKLISSFCCLYTRDSFIPFSRSCYLSGTERAISVMDFREIYQQIDRSFHSNCRDNCFVKILMC